MSDEPLTRDQLRSRRVRTVRATTINVERISLRERKLRLAMYPDTNHSRPKTRGDCASVPRPCPYVGSRHNLYLDVSGNGSIKLNFPDLEVDEMGESCALDAAEHCGLTLDQVAPLLNITRERVRQIEERAQRSIEELEETRELAED